MWSELNFNRITVALALRITRQFEALTVIQEEVEVVGNDQILDIF